MSWAPSFDTYILMPPISQNRGKIAFCPGSFFPKNSNRVNLRQYAHVHRAEQLDSYTFVTLSGACKYPGVILTCRYSNLETVKFMSRIVIITSKTKFLIYMTVPVFI